MKLTAKEEEIMTIFWEHGEMFIRDVLKYIPEPKPSYNTVATQIMKARETATPEIRILQSSRRLQNLISAT